MAAHTDPGLFTAKFLSETPGLELLDVPWRCLVVGYVFFGLYIPIPSMYGIYTYIWLIFMVNVW